MGTNLHNEIRQCNGYATWQVMEEYLPNDIYKHYRKVFNRFDAEGTGVISIENVASILSKNGSEYSPDHITSLMRKIISCDHYYSSNEQFVDFPEFLAIMSSISKNCIPEEEILQIFNVFDQDGDGFIGQNELRQLLSKLGDEVSETEVEEMIAEADRDGDGLVSYQEFVRIITNSVDNGPIEIDVNRGKVNNATLKRNKRSVKYENIGETLRRNMGLFSETFLKQQNMKNKRLNAVDEEGDKKKLQRKKSLKRALSGIKQKALRRARSVSTTNTRQTTVQEVKPLPQRQNTWSDMLSSFQNISNNFRSKSKQFFNSGDIS